MKILFVGDPCSPVIAYLRKREKTLVLKNEPLTLQSARETDCEFLISHGYRHILRRDVLSVFPDRAINLHISYLPWNRGADPNFWSFLDDTPKGVTIHCINEGVDTGDIIAQRQVKIGDEHTLATSYALLQKELVSLFIEQWPMICEGRSVRTAQKNGGTFHRTRDKEPFAFLLSAKGWNTPVALIAEHGRRLRASTF